MDVVNRDLMALPGSTKVATVRTLVELQAQGVLDGTSTERQLLTAAQQCTETHAHADTPYGPVVQKVPLGIAKLPHWEICHPMAYLWYMTKISPAFASVVTSCTQSGKPLRLVIYCDEMIPGNPFRPEKKPHADVHLLGVRRLATSRVDAVLCLALFVDSA